jgi:hypothetical protein
VTYRTSIRMVHKGAMNTRRDQTNKNIVPVPFAFDDSEYLDKLITYNVSAFLYDGCAYDPGRRTLAVFGNVWTPPEHIMYYPEDVEALFGH